jgi:hypothetical protein
MLDRIIALTKPENIVSRRVVEKIGRGNVKMTVDELGSPDCKRSVDRRSNLHFLENVPKSHRLVYCHFFVSLCFLGLAFLTNLDSRLQLVILFLIGVFSSLFGHTIIPEV